MALWKRWTILWCIGASLCSAEPEVQPPSFIRDTSGLQLSPIAYPQYQQRKLLLDNGLEVLLTSDPGAKTAAALSVGVGSLQDPPEWHGLAHFLEHMLFQGTRKYPEPTSYYRFIADHGGKRNAYTASDRTVYALSIPPEHLQEALDRFAQFFVDPILNEEVLARELHAVHQEFLRNRESDFWRAEALIKETLDAQHPAHTFDMGNFESLQKASRKDLQQFWDRYYTTDRMRLVVQSNLPLDELQKQVNATFGVIPKRIGSPPPQMPDEVLSAPAHGSVLYSPSQGEQRMLHMVWALPQGMILDLEDAPHWHLTHLLTAGNEGGLLDDLHRKGWIHDLDADTENLTQGQALFHIVLDLTPEGAQHWQDVAAEVYAYLDRLEHTPLPGATEEQAIQFSLQRYLYRARGDAFIEVMQQADQLLDEGMETYPRLSLAPRRWHRHTFKTLLRTLRPAEGVHLLQLPMEEIPEKLTLTEPWFQVSYLWRALSSEELSNLSTAPSGLPIRLPLPNPLMAQTFDLADGKSTGRAWQWPRPTLLEQSDRATIYWEQDEYFRLPRCVLTLRLLSPVFGDSLSHVVEEDLLLCMWHQRLLAFETLAGAADLHLIGAPEGKYIELSVEGLSDHAAEALLEMTRVLRHLQWTDEEFEQGKEELSNLYAQAMEGYGHQRARALFEQLVQPPCWDLPQRQTALEQLDTQALSTWWQQACEKLYVQALWYGNISHTQAQKLTDHVHGILQTQPWPLSAHPLQQLASIQPTAQLSLVRCPSPGSGQAITLGIPMELHHPQDRVLLRLFSSAFEEPFFSALRGQQKTGYSLSTSYLECQGKMGWLLFTQLSYSHAAPDLLGRDQAFLADRLHEPYTFLSKERFEALRHGLLRQWADPLSSQRETADWILRRAFEDQCAFDWASSMVQATRALTYEVALDRWLSWLTVPRGQLAVWIDGSLDPNQQAIRELGTLEEAEAILQKIEVSPLCTIQQAE